MSKLENFAEPKRVDPGGTEQGKDGQTGGDKLAAVTLGSALPSSHFCFRERIGAARLGIHDLDVIRRLRQEHLTEGEDWARLHNRIMWSEAALKKIAGALAAQGAAKGASAPPSRPGPQKSGGGAQAEESGPARRAIALLPEAAGSLEPQAVTVTLVPSRNRRLLCAALPGAEKDRARWITISVRSNAHFVPGMKVLAEPQSQGSWIFRGQPGRTNPTAHLPRSKGRW